MFARGWAVFVVASVAAYITLAATRSAQMWWLGDLRVYQAGGSAALHGDGGSLYDIVVGGAKLPFTYTPWAAVLFSPLSLLPWSVAKPFVIAGNLALLFAAASLAWGLAGLARPHVRHRVAAVTAAVLLWTEPVQETLRFGQINLLLLCAVLYDLSRPRGARLVGVWIGIATGVKLTPAIFLVYLLATGRWREARNGIVAFLLTVLAGLAVLPHASLRYWNGLFLDSRRMGPLEFAGNQSLRGALARTFSDTQPDAAIWVPITVVVGVLGIVVAAVHYRRAAAFRDEATRRHGELCGLCITALTGLLVSPISWSHHWVWIVPGAVLMASAARTVRAPARWRPALVLGAACVLPALMLAPPTNRVELPQAVPTGIIWHVPNRYGRELHLTAPDLLIVNSYVIIGLFLLALCAVILCRIGTYTGRERVGGAGHSAGRRTAPNGGSPSSSDVTRSTRPGPEPADILTPAESSGRPVP